MTDDYREDVRPKSAKEVLEKAIAYNGRRLATLDDDIRSHQAQIDELMEVKERLQAECVNYAEALTALRPPQLEKEKA